MDLAQRATLTAERRGFSDIELRDDNDDKTVTFDGVASVVDTPYQVRDMFGEFEETVAKGAFAKTLKERDDVRLLVNHTGVPIARTKSKTLTLTASPDLRAVAKLDAANPTVQEIRSAMGRGDLDQMSIGFRVTRQEWDGEYTKRLIREVQLFDVSVVTFPASPTTTASVRALDEAVKAITDGQDYEPDMVRRAIAILEAQLDGDDSEAHAIALAHAESARRALAARALAL